jgi:hypothetical protein
MDKAKLWDKLKEELEIMAEGRFDGSYWNIDQAAKDLYERMVLMETFSK